MSEESNLAQGRVHELKGISASLMSLSYSLSSDIEDIISSLTSLQTSPADIVERLRGLGEDLMAIQQASTIAHRITTSTNDSGILLESTQMSKFRASEVGECLVRLLMPYAKKFDRSITFLDDASVKNVEVRGYFDQIFILKQNLVLNAINYGKQEGVDVSEIIVSIFLVETLAEVRSLWGRYNSQYDHRWLSEEPTLPSELLYEPEEEIRWYVCVTEDRGRGMPADTVNNLFNPDRVHVATPSDVPNHSTGIGLANTCRRLTESMKGMIGAASTESTSSTGKPSGSCFFFGVPVLLMSQALGAQSAEDTTARTIHSEHSIAYASSSVKRISTTDASSALSASGSSYFPSYSRSDSLLMANPWTTSAPYFIVVDDSSTTIKAVEKRVKKLFRRTCHCNSYSNCVDALKRLKELADGGSDCYGGVTLMFVDVHLGPDSGVVLCEAIREMEQKYGFDPRPIVFLSADDVSNDVINSVGAHSFIKKDEKMGQHVDAVLKEFGYSVYPSL
eukprot:gene27782-33556_t